MEGEGKGGGERLACARLSKGASHTRPPHTQPTPAAHAAVDNALNRDQTDWLDLPAFLAR